MYITFLECLSLQRSNYSLQCFAVNDWLLIGPEFQSYDSQHFDVVSFIPDYTNE